MDFDKLFWDASVDDLKQGYVMDNDKYVCLCCGETFEKGIIYNNDKVLMDAAKAINYHISTKHGSMFSFLLNMDKKYTGLTDIQKNLLNMFYEGLSDKEIVKETESTSSTIRNTRFALREKAKQAKIFLSLMTILEGKMDNKGDSLVPIHRNATNVDDRYDITENEKELFLNKYFNDGKLISFPIKQKRIIVVLQYIAGLFEKNRKYTEKEVNEILKGVYSDYVTIRRYLIEYGFMDRTQDCHEYWVKL